MKLHPLRYAYIDYIREEYGHVVSGDKCPERTEAVAQKVAQLGLNYDMYVDVACSLWHRWATRKGWPYPYWNIVVADITFERIGRMLTLIDTEDFRSIGVREGHDNLHDGFAAELSYALDYIWWVNSMTGSRPRGPHSNDVTVKIAVAEYICTMYGIPFYSSDYNWLARTLRSQLRKEWDV